MAKIALSGKYGLGRFLIVDDIDLEEVGQYKWYLQKHGRPIASTLIDIGGVKKRKTLLAHRLIIIPPNGFEIDHIDGNPLNNSRSNLRICTRTQNMQNRRGWRKTGYKGIYLYKDPRRKNLKETWAAHIVVHGKKIRLGFFSSSEAAARAYDKAALKYHGEFAYVNFPMLF